jgi:hypothetical protein
MKPSALSQFVDYIRSQVPVSTGDSVDDTSADYAIQTEGQTQPQPDEGQPQTPFLMTIVVSPQGLIVHGKGWQQFKATGCVSDGSKPDMTNSVKWFTGDPTVAWIGGPGRVFFTGKQGSVMVNVKGYVEFPKSDGKIKCTQLFGVPVAVLPPQPKTPDQHDNGGQVYAQLDSDLSNAASPVEGSAEGTGSSSLSGSTDALSASASSGGDASVDASGDSVQMADTGSASRVGDIPNPSVPHVHKLFHPSPVDPIPEMPHRLPPKVVSEGTADLSSAASTVEGTAPDCLAGAGSAGNPSADAPVGGDAAAGTTSGSDDTGGLSGSATATSD